MGTKEDCHLFRREESEAGASSVAGSLLQLLDTILHSGYKETL